MEVRTSQADQEHAKESISVLISGGETKFFLFRTNVAPSPLNLFTTWMVLLRKRFKGDSSLLFIFLCRYNEIRAERKKAKMRFRRAMREEIMAKAPGMR